MSENTSIQKETSNELSKKLNESVLSVLGSDKLLGFEKAYQIANAIQFLKENLTPEYMKPIMAMQGSRLGFKTDKDKEGGYPLAIVKDCLIDATLTGVQPYGNQFNIIAGNMYVTKEGYGHLLSKIKGLKYTITPLIPKIEGTVGEVEMLIKWDFNGNKEEEKIKFSTKVNAYMGNDGVIGKATRKARAWLFNKFSEIEITDGDVEDIDFIEVKSDKKQAVSKEELEEINKKNELLRLKNHLMNDIQSLEELKSLEDSFDEKSEEEKELIELKRQALLKKQSKKNG